MLGWFRKRSTPSAHSNLVAIQPAGEVFAWPRGTTLTALDETLIALPKAILEPSDVISSVIQGDDDMQMSIPEGEDRLLLRLRPAMSVTLSKSCQACVVSEDGQARRFRVSGPTGKPDA